MLPRFTRPLQQQARRYMSHHHRQPQQSQNAPSGVDMIEEREFSKLSQALPPILFFSSLTVGYDMVLKNNHDFIYADKVTKFDDQVARGVIRADGSLPVQKIQYY